MWKSLIYYRRIHIAVVLAAAVTTAVLTGSLLVGDSVRGSLAELVVGRLGKIDQAVVSSGFFREALASDVKKGIGPGVDGDVVPAILLNGTAIHASSGRRASQIQIQGIPPEFADLYPANDGGGDSLRQLGNMPDGAFPPVILNESLRVELQAKTGDQILIKFDQHAEVPQESLLGQRDAFASVRTLRLTVGPVLPDSGAGRFGLQPGQLLPLNAFVPLPVLQRALGQGAAANTLLISKTFNARETVSRTWTLEDAGLRLRENGAGMVSVESREIFLSDTLAAGIESAGSRMPHQSILVYIANTLESEGGSVPYSTIAAMEVPAGAAFGPLKQTDGSPVGELHSGEILLNQWTAEQLKARPGDAVRLTCFVPGAGNELLTQQSEFHVAGVVQMEGPGADPSLAPEFPGIQEEHMSEWDVPFPVDLSRIRPQDEDYWDRYRAAPKAIVSLEDGRRLWGSRYGSLTSIRFASPQAPQLKTQLEQDLLRSLSPETVGFRFLPVRQQGLRAADGSTDFSGLFIGFSLFLITAACLLTALLFRLGAELRAPEIGLLLAIGYPEKSVRRRLLREGLLLAFLGAGLGMAAAAGYTAAMLAGLRNWWTDAIGTPFLQLHVSAVSLGGGAALSVVLVAVVLWRSVRRLAQLPAPALLARQISSTNTVESSRWLRHASRGLPVIAVALLALSFARPANAAPLFFTSGSLLLAAGLCAFRLWMGRRREVALHGMGSLAMRNSVWNPTRSLLSAALVCAACFVIVAVGANRRSETAGSSGKSSGTGGFTLVAQSDIPLLRPLESSDLISDPAVRKQLSHGTFSLRYLPGEDASCLNLYRPQKPRLLGVPKSWIARGGFSFSQTLEDSANPWSQLEADLGPGVIPAIGDANSVQWILHSGIGKDLEMQDAAGRPVRLRLVGTLEHSIFQSELLVSEENFRKYWPDRHGYSYFLMDVPQEGLDVTERSLESDLGDFGFDAIRTSARLARFHAVENTYLAVFQALGGLGLILGTLGLAVILLRNIAERRKELATLQAFGFRRSRIARMVWLESTFLLSVGLVLGTAAAGVAISPQILADPAQIPWSSLLLTLGLVFATGTIAGAVASRAALRAPLLTTLKGE